VEAQKRRWVTHRAESKGGKSEAKKVRVGQGEPKCVNVMIVGTRGKLDNYGKPREPIKFQFRITGSYSKRVRHKCKIGHQKIEAMWTKMGKKIEWGNLSGSLCDSTRRNLCGAACAEFGCSQERTLESVAGEQGGLHAERKITPKSHIRYRGRELMRFSNDLPQKNGEKSEKNTVENRE